MGKIDSGGQTDLGLWQAIMPDARINMVTNPSFEKGTTGWTPTNATLVQTAGAGQFGAYGGRMLASATNGKAATTLASVASGSANVGSVYVKSTSPLVQIKVTIGASSSVQFHPGDGLFHRIETPVTAPSTTTPVLEIIDTRTSGWDNVDIDGVQFENGLSVASTYMDGDQAACQWTGPAHASTTRRDGRNGRGGVLSSLDVAGLLITQMKGTGYPDFDISTTDLALADGATYQRSTAKSRTMTLTGLLIANGLTSGFHAARRAAFASLNPELRAGRGPIRLRYVGSGTPKIIDTYLSKGLGWDKVIAATEEPEIEFEAPDPMWYGETDQQAALSTNAVLSSTSYILQRDAQGNWSTMAGGIGGTGTFVGAIVRGQDGRLYVSGGWTGGVASTSHLAVWNGSAWSSIGSPNAQINAMTAAPDGSIIIAGIFTTVNGGATSASKIARYTPSTGTWAALGSGLASTRTGYAVVSDVLGSIYVAGQDSSGSLNPFVSRWNGVSWNDFNTGLPAAGVGGVALAIARGPDGTMYAGVGGLGTNGVYHLPLGSSTWVAIGDTSGGDVNALAWSDDGYLYAGGNFTTIGGVSASRVARWNGVAWEAMGPGLNANGPAAIAAGPLGRLYVGGTGFTFAGSIILPSPLAVWNGSAWSKVDVILPTGAIPVTQGMYVDPDGTLTIGWGNAGNAQVPVIATITNNGSSMAYPIFRVPSSGLFYSLENHTTGQRIDFNISNSANELTIDLRPGRRSIYSPFKSEIASVLPGSNWSAWGLAPGDNLVSLFTGVNVTTGVSWRQRSWSAD